MNSSKQLPTNIQPVITNQLKKVCLDYIKNRKWYEFGDYKQISIAKKILGYLDLNKNLTKVNIEYLELTSACIFHALFKVLSSPENIKFFLQAKDETQHIESVLDIQFYEIPNNEKTKYAVKLLTTILQQSDTIEFNIDSLQRKSRIIDLHIQLKNANNDKESQQKILSATTLSPLDRKASPDHFDSLIYLMTTTAVRIGCLDSLKNCLPYFLSDAPHEHQISRPLSFTPDFHLISNAVSYHQKNILEWLLSDESPLPINENVLYQAATILIYQDQHDIANLSSDYFDIASIIFNETRFNPNYSGSPGSEPLLEMAINIESLYFINLLLQHPGINLKTIKDDLPLYANIELKSKQIDCLLKDPRFYALENDWLEWSNQNMKGADREAFQKIAVLNYLLHHLPKWQLFNLADNTQGEFSDIKNQLMKAFYKVACPSIETFFLKNPHHGLFAKKSNAHSAQMDIVISDLTFKKQLKST